MLKSLNFLKENICSIFTRAASGIEKFGLLGYPNPNFLKILKTRNYPNARRFFSTQEMEITSGWKLTETLATLQYLGILIMLSHKKEGKNDEKSCVKTPKTQYPNPKICGRVFSRCKRTRPDPKHEIYLPDVAAPIFTRMRENFFLPEG